MEAEGLAVALLDSLAFENRQEERSDNQALDLSCCGVTQMPSAILSLKGWSSSGVLQL
jgi:hypothetical protein